MMSGSASILISSTKINFKNFNFPQSLLTIDTSNDEVPPSVIIGSGSLPPRKRMRSRGIDNKMSKVTSTNVNPNNISSNPNHHTFTPHQSSTTPSSKPKKLKLAADRFGQEIPDFDAFIRGLKNENDQKK